MVSGCHGWIGQTVPAVLESRSGTEAVFLPVMVEETVHSSLDCPILLWKLVRISCSYCLKNKKIHLKRKHDCYFFLFFTRAMSWCGLCQHQLPPWAVKISLCSLPSFLCTYQYWNKLYSIASFVLIRSSQCHQIIKVSHSGDTVSHFGSTLFKSAS